MGARFAVGKALIRLAGGKGPIIEEVIFAPFDSAARAAYETARNAMRVRS
jgi:hypothetical protein